MGLFSKPKIPDPNVAAIAGMTEDMVNLPLKAKIDALAQMGGRAVIDGKEYDFTGLGTADNNAVISDQMAQAMLDIQKNYGADYIKQRLANLQQSDPTGYAARKQMFDRILADANKNPDRPLADDLQQQMAEALAQGGNLTTGPNSQIEQIQQDVRGKQLANGIFLGNAPASQEASAVFQAGDAMKQQRQSQAAGFLNSGVTPEDVEYRRIQQGLSNLGTFVGGQSPISEFSSLSGAQGGAAPFDPGQVFAPKLNPNAGYQGMQNASQLYSGQVNWANSQVNPWVAGLSTGINALGAAKSMGAFGTPSGFTGYGTGIGSKFDNSNLGAIKTGIN